MLSHTRGPCDEMKVRWDGDVKDCGRSTGRWVLAAAILGSSITFIDGTVVNVALPILQEELRASVAGAQWIVESYALMLASLILVGGSLGDRLGRRRVFMTGVALFGVASLWCGLTGGIVGLVIARSVQGIGAALLVPGSLALISANFEKKRRGRAIGTWSGFTAIAAGIGPVIGGWLVQHYSWRWIFFINLPLVGAVLAISWFFVPESHNERTKGRVDIIGAALATVALGGIVFGLIQSGEQGFRSPFVIISLIVGVSALIAFVVVEARIKDPMMPLDLFRSATFSGANLLTLFLYAALGGLLFFLPFNLIQIQGYSPAAAGAALLPFVITMFVLSRWAGGLVDHYGSKLPLIIGPLIAGAGFGLFALPAAPAGSFWTSFFPAIMVMSAGMSIAVAPLTTTVMGAVEERHAGVASGINNAVSRTASLLAVAVFGVLMLGVFTASLDRRLSATAISAETRTQVVAGAGSLNQLKVPEGTTSADEAIIQEAIRGSFVDGFRVVALIAAAMAVLSAIASWWLIEGKQTRK